VTALAVAADGVVIAAPWQRYQLLHSPLDLGTGPLDPPGDNPMVLAKLDPSGTPLWSAAFGDERITSRKAAGLALGMAGVALIAQPSGIATGPHFGWAIAAALGACCAYGATGVRVKRLSGGASARGMAAGNQLAAALVLLPLLLVMPPLASPSALVIANVLGLALLASGVAFVLYFRLIADVGATRALTVTYLIPLFGVFWGWLFLGEALPASALGGGVLILGGTVLVTRG